MIYVIEGADLVGKTHVSELLSKATGIPVARLWVNLEFAESGITSVSNSMISICDAVQPELIMDRFFFSEFIYGPIYGRSIHYLGALAEQWASRGSIAVSVILASSAELEERFQARGDKMNTLAQIIEANEKYKDLSKHLPASISVNYTHTLNRSIQQIAGEVATQFGLNIRGTPGE